MSRWLTALSLMDAARGSDEPQRKEQRKIKVQSRLLFPTFLQSAPYTEPDSWESPELGEQLRVIGINASEHYRQNIYPHELQMDPDFFASKTEARKQLEGFLRWQRRVVSEKKGWPIDELDSQYRTPVSFFCGMNYTYEDLFSTPVKKLTSAISKMSMANLKRMGHRFEEQTIREYKENGVHPLRVFLWAETYQRAEQLLPHSHAGAMFAGLYVASNPNGVKMGMLDPRGDNPPFGKVFMVDLDPHWIYMQSSYSSSFITAQQSETPAVFWHFLVYPADGPGGLDWEDDPLTGYEHFWEQDLVIKTKKSSSVQHSEL